MYTIIYSSYWGCSCKLPPGTFSKNLLTSHLTLLRLYSHKGVPNGNNLNKYTHVCVQAYMKIYYEEYMYTHALSSYLSFFIINCSPSSCHPVADSSLLTAENLVKLNVKQPWKKQTLIVQPTTPPSASKRTTHATTTSLSPYNGGRKKTGHPPHTRRTIRLCLGHQASPGPLSCPSKSNSWRLEPSTFRDVSLQLVSHRSFAGRHE